MLPKGESGSPKRGDLNGEPRRTPTSNRLIKRLKMLLAIIFNW